MNNILLKKATLLLSVVFLTMLNATSAMAQTKIADKEIIGVWIMSSMKYEGENKELIDDSYNQVKVFRANGEYACAEIAKDKNGTYYILPHEYGSYTLKNGMYSEMGRKAHKHEWISKTAFKSRWKNRMDEWRKVKDFPESLAQHIVDKCKANQTSPEDMQKLMKKYIFGK